MAAFGNNRPILLNRYLFILQIHFFQQHGNRLTSIKRIGDSVNCAIWHDKIIIPQSGCSSMVEPQLPKLIAWVRFPSPAPSDFYRRCRQFFWRIDILKRLGVGKYRLGIA